MFRLLSLILTWAAATLIAVSPAIVGADTGGILPWTRWAIAIGAMAALLLALPGILANPNASFRALSVPLCLFAFALIGLVQLLALPESIGKSLAPGSYQIYEDTANSISLSSQIDLTTIEVTPSISISRWFTQDATAFMVVLAAIAFVSTQVYLTRSRISFLLICLAIAGAIHAILGMYQVTAKPDSNVWGIVNIYGGQPFGAYFNRNNASVILNLGLASGLGLVAWRLAAITGVTISEKETGFVLSEWIDVLFDRIAMIGVLCSLITVAGLFACGSRGGIAGAIAGLLLAFGLVQSIHRGQGIIATLIAVAAIAGVLLVQFEVPARSIDRLTQSKTDLVSEAGLKEARWGHWQDGWRTALVQPTLGWGIGAYRYAYLPYQKTSSAGWFANADNMWLEWFVETGMVGCIVLLGVLIVIGQSLSLLNASADPIDHGLATAGWFTLGSMAVSQAFDFGCRIPANSIMLSIIASVVVGRAAVAVSVARKLESNSRDESSLGGRGPRELRRAPTSRGLALALGVVALLCIGLVPAIKTLESFAHSDHWLRLARLLPREALLNENKASEILRSADEYTRRAPSDARLLLAQSRLAVDVATWNAATQTSAKSGNTSPQTLSTLYQALSPAALRSAWYAFSPASPDRSTDATGGSSPTNSPPSSVSSPVSSTDASPLSNNALQASTATKKADQVRPPLLPFQNAAGSADTNRENEAADNDQLQLGTEFHQARTLALRSLALNPQADDVIRTVIGLDFAGGTPEQSRQLLAKYMDLRVQNARSQLIASRFAAQAKFWDLATAAWMRCLELDPYFTQSIIEEFPKDAPMSLAEILPMDPRVLSVAAAHELNSPKPSSQVLIRAITVIQRSLSDEPTQRLDQLKLLSRIHSKRGQHELAAQSLSQAIPLAPGDCDLRYAYAVALRSAGNRNEARQQARVGRQLAPNDPRFEQILDMTVGSE